MKYFFLFLLGSAWGSFLNVLIFRYKPNKKFNFFKVISGRSYCPYCKRKLLKRDLIPIISFLVLKGKCRFCQRQISWIYPVVEILSGILAILIFLKTSPSVFLFLLWFLAFSHFLVLSFIDLKYLFVPNQLLNSLLLVSIVLVIFFQFPGHYFWKAFPQFNWRILNHLVGGIIFGLPMWIFCVRTKEEFLGLGDAKAMAISCFLFGWPKSILVFNLSFLIGGVFSLFLMVFFKKGLKLKIPFFPFLALANFLVFFWEAEIVKLYLSFF